MKIIYYGHSCYIISYDNIVLVFDYFSNTDPDKTILSELQDKNVYVFVSHDHFDHFDKEIFTFDNVCKSINYIFGFPYKHENSTVLLPHQSITIDNIIIRTLKSNDSGVGFLINTKRHNIIHLGDHAMWEDETKDSFTNEIDYFSKYISEPDILFIAVCSSSGILQKTMENGVEYANNILNPQLIIPLHANGKEYLYKEFKDKNPSLPFWFPEKPQDKLEL